MTEEAGTRWVALFCATILHVAVGLALLSATSRGAPVRGGTHHNTGRTIVVDILPFDRPAESENPSLAAEPGDGSQEAEPLVHSASQGGVALVIPTLTTSTTDAQDGSSKVQSEAPRSTSDLPSAEVLAYRARLQTHLARYRIYPAAAQGAGQQGVVVLHFVMDRGGQVIDVWVEASSGAVAIDNEAIAAVMRAQPLPAFPGEWPDRLSISLPVTFRLG